jgi:hypothetical protein
VFHIDAVPINEPGSSERLHDLSLSLERNQHFVLWGNDTCVQFSKIQCMTQAGRVDVCDLLSACLLW